MSVSDSMARVPWAAAAIVRVLIICLLAAALLPLGAADRASASGITHLVVSEVATGGTSASDELIELYNPTSAVMPLEGLELVYVTASGATVSRRAAWELGAPDMPAGSHLLVANELGTYAAIADATYAAGMAATGGSVALRIQGASTAIDAVGWGTAVGTWLEGTPAAAPPPGGSLERLPGGAAGSTADTNDNAADFAVRMVPDPQNSGSPPVPDPTAPSPVPTPSPTPTPAPTPAPTATSTVAPSPSGSPTPTAMPIADARSLPDGSVVTIEGSALTASDFTDGGGYLADASGGIAVLLDGGSFARGDTVNVRGTLDDRFAQRTIRASVDDVTVTGIPGADPTAPTSATGAVGESLEADLVRIAGTIEGSPTLLSGGLAFEVDDGSGAVRVIVGSATGIDTSSWASGTALGVVGVVGQRDSTGTGAAGYRVQPRDAADVASVAAPTPIPSGSQTPDRDPTPAPPPADGSVISIADARAAAKNARVLVRGVVTLPSGTIDPGSAVIQDASGAILLRLGDEAGSVSRGELLEVAGVRSTKAGMDSLRVSVAPRRLGSAADPAPRALRSGDASEASEAQLVVVRGALVASARQASSGTVSFEIDDGSGPLRVVLGASLAAEDEALVAGTWIEASGVLGQETTGAQPLRGYRVWPRSAADLRILAGATDASNEDGGSGGGAGGMDGGGGDAVAPSLSALGDGNLVELRVGATLVAGPWPELGVSGLLWDGARLVGVAPSAVRRLEPILDAQAAPLALELTGLREDGTQQGTGLPLVTLGADPGDTVVGSAPPDAPSAIMPGSDDPPAWVSLVGRVTTERARTTIEFDGTIVAVERHCRRKDEVPQGAVTVVGVAISNPSRIMVGCDGLRPAPALALTLAAAATAGRAQAAGPAGASLNGADAATVERRLIASALLAIGVGVMLAGIVAGRRIRGDDPEAVAAVEQSLGQPASPGPQLTLVRVPNEHGP